MRADCDTDHDMHGCTRWNGDHWCECPHTKSELLEIHARPVPCCARLRGGNAADGELGAQRGAETGEITQGEQP